VLITDLNNYAMPFIRYEIGDVAVIRAGTCPCGLPGIRMDVQGRIQDCLPGHDGTVLTSDRITDAILSPAIFAFQLEYRDGGNVALQIVPRSGAQPDYERLRQILIALLGPVRIAIRTVPTILPEPGGKFRFVKNLSNSAASLV
jgi:phenylacetate-CoA ligase